MILFFCGVPLSGKSTIAKEICQNYMYGIFSTGALVKNKGLLKEESVIKHDLSLTLNEEINKCVHDIITKNSYYIIDGFPRSIEQFMLIKNWSEKYNIKYKIVFFIANPVLLYERMKQRNRETDVFEIVKNRIEKSISLFREFKQIGDTNFWTYNIDDEGDKKTLLEFVCED